MGVVHHRSPVLRVRMAGIRGETGLLLLKPGFGGFRYADGYQGPALDPIHLPLARNRTFPLQKGGDGASIGDGTLPNAFAALLPGVFGSRAAESLIPDWASSMDAEKLFLLTSQHGRKGAVVLASLTGECAPSAPEIRGHKQAWRAMEAARALTAPGTGMEAVIDNSLLRAFTMGDGGARPKFTMLDADGRPYLVKFNMPLDAYDTVLVEHITHRMAADAGLATVRSAVLGPANKSGRVLAMARYDRNSVGEAIYRVPLAALVDRGGSAYGYDYEDILQVVEMLCPDQREQLFLQMVFHAVLNNTDNHLYQFELLAQKNGGWRLAPNYDSLPDTSRTACATAFCGWPRPEPSRAFIEHLARRFHLEARKAVSVLRVAAGMASYLDQPGLGKAERQWMHQSVDTEGWGRVLSSLERD